MIGSTTFSVKRYSIITTTTTITPRPPSIPIRTKTTSKRQTRGSNIILAVLLFLCYCCDNMTFSTCRRVVAFTVRNQNVGSAGVLSSHARRMMMPTTTTTSSFFTTVLSSSKNDDYSTTVPETTTTTPGKKFTAIPRRPNNGNANDNKLFPTKFTGRTYSTNGRSGSNPNQKNRDRPWIPQSSFSTTSSFEDDDLDAALDNVLSPSSASTANRNTPDIPHNPVRHAIFFELDVARMFEHRVRCREQKKKQAPTHTLTFILTSSLDPTNLLGWDHQLERSGDLVHQQYPLGQIGDGPGRD